MLQPLLLTLLGAAGTGLGGLLVVLQPCLSFKRLGALQVRGYYRSRGCLTTLVHSDQAQKHAARASSCYVERPLMLFRLSHLVVLLSCGSFPPSTLKRCVLLLCPPLLFALAHRAWLLG